MASFEDAAVRAEKSLRIEPALLRLADAAVVRRLLRNLGERDRLVLVPRYILPKPSEIVTKAWADWPVLTRYTWITGFETLLGYLTALVLAVPLASRSPSRAFCARPSIRSSSASR